MVRALDDGVGVDAAESRLKVPPNSVEAEQSLLGGLMLDNQAWDKVADLLTDVDFYRKDHRLIFSAIATLAEDGQPCDIVTVSEFLDKRNELDGAGGLDYLASLANETPGAANARAYARILRERSILRSLITAGNEISGSAYATDGRPATELVDDAERLVFEIAEKGSRGRAGFKALKQILPATVDRIDLLHQAGGDITGIPTGYNEFDKLTAGLQAGDLIIIAGRPSMGKTTLAINIAAWYAIEGSRVALVDFDPQQSAMDWLSTRPEDRPPIEGVVVSEPGARVPRGVEVVVMDAPAATHGRAVVELLRRAETCLIPVVPSPIDLMAASRFMEELMEVGHVLKRKVRVATIANRVRENSPGRYELEDYLRSMRLPDGRRLPFVAVLRNTQNYVHAAERGLSIFEIAPSRTEHDMELWDPLTRWLSSKRSLPG